LVFERAAHFAQGELSVYYVVEETPFYHPQVLERPVSQVPVNLRKKDMMGNGAVRIGLGKRYARTAGRIQPTSSNSGIDKGDRLRFGARAQGGSRIMDGLGSESRGLSASLRLP
jgi:hypothetical protein